MRYALVTTNEAYLFDRHEHRAGQQGSKLPHIFCSPLRCLWSRHKSQDMSQDVTPLQVWYSRLTSSRSTNWQFENIAKISVTSHIVINMPTREPLAAETKSSFV